MPRHAFKSVSTAFKIANEIRFSRKNFRLAVSCQNRVGEPSRRPIRTEELGLGMKSAALIDRSEQQQVLRRSPVSLNRGDVSCYRSFRPMFRTAVQCVPINPKVEAGREQKAVLVGAVVGFGRVVDGLGPMSGSSPLTGARG